MAGSKSLISEALAIETAHAGADVVAETRNDRGRRPPAPAPLGRRGSDAAGAGEAALVAAFAEGAATGEARGLSVLETPLSRIFLGARRVYKLLRPRRHVFADLVRLSARRRALEEEFSINRRTSPDLYVALEPVTRSRKGVIALAGAGRIVDWALVMRRFAARDLFAAMADDGRLAAAHVRAAAQALARLHSGERPVFGRRGASSEAEIIEEVSALEAEAALRLGVAPRLQPLLERLADQQTILAPLIEARRAAGRVRRGHGDAHLANICLFRDEVTLFDAIGFDPKMATGDVLYDLAFLVMDLAARDEALLANVAMNAYLDASGEDEAGLALMPFFIGLRAAVRAAVCLQGGDAAGFARFLAAGEAALSPFAPRLVAVGGLSGTGKSALAAALAPRLPGPCGARLLRSDVLRKSLAGVPLTTPLPPSAYTNDARAALSARLAATARTAVAAGSSVIVDATFADERARAAALKAPPGVRVDAFWLAASAAERLRRVADRRGDASDIDPARAAAQGEPADLGDFVVVDAERPQERVLADVCERLGLPVGD